MPTVNSKYSLERLGSSKNAKPIFYESTHLSSPKTSLHSDNHSHQSSAYLPRKSTSKVSPEINYEEFPELPSQRKFPQVVICEEFPELLSRLKLSESVKELKSALKKTKSTTERMISFNSIISYDETWSRDEYDRTSVPMATLTFVDVIELRIMRQDATRQALTEAGFRPPSIEIHSPPFTGSKPLERRHSQTNFNQAVPQEIVTSNNPRRFSNPEPPQHFMQNQNFLPHCNYTPQYGYFSSPSAFFSPDFAMFPPQRFGANTFTPGYNLPGYIHGLAV
ncbi:hypothetical protein HK096_002416 [Nowakowskiella sp. JEL0078]|nr:hypothetical protein HK096_002416 [Nowakowskiella sp. JEL0078]